MEMRVLKSPLPMLRPSATVKSIGAILIDAGRLTAAEAERVLAYQQEDRSLRFGDAAIRLGLLGAEDIRFAVARQFDSTYLPVEDTSLSPQLVAAFRPTDPLVEQLRRLRLQIMLRLADDSARTTAITSVTAGEGKTFVAANLAVVFAQLGERTLLIDADLRAGNLHEVFKLDNRYGLSSLLAGREDDDVITAIKPIDKLSVITSGPTPPNPQELLSRARFTELLKRLQNDFDVILLDTSAWATASDAQMVAARAGSSIMVSRPNSAPVSQAAEFVDALRQTGAHLLGAVLNQY